MAKEIAGLFFDHLHEAAVIIEKIEDEAGKIVDWRLVDANPAALRGTALARESIVGHTIQELFSTGEVRWLNEEYQHARSAGESNPQEVVFRGRTYLVSSFSIDVKMLAVVASDITERKRAEEELHTLTESLADSEEKYREMAESITDPLTAYDSNLRLVYRNAASERTTNIPREAALGKTFAELYPDLVGGEVHQAYLSTLETCQPQHIHTEWVRPKDGQKFVFDLNTYPTRQGLVAFSKDITIQARAEEELRKAHDRAEWMARLPDENPNPVIRIALDGRVLYRNQAAREWDCWTTSDGEKLAEPLLPLVDEAQARKTRTKQDVLLAGRSYTVLLVPYEQDGYINLYAGDITERVQMEKALRKSEEKFSRVFATSPVAMAISRLSDERFIDVNASFSRINGYTREELLGRTGLELGLLGHPEQRDGLAKMLREQSGFQNVEMQVRNRQGELQTVLISFETIHLDGEPCIITTVIDITERKQSEEALRDSQALALERANELEALMDAVPAMIWISRDPQCRTMTGNRQGYEFLQLGQNANLSVTAPDYVIAAQPYHNMKDGRELAPEEMPMQVAAATGKPARDYTFDLVFYNGPTYHLMGNVNPLFDLEGKPYGAIGAFMDITPLRKMEARQVESRAQIEVQHRLMESRERERQGIARDIHDGPIQTLVSTAFNIQFVKEAYQDPALNVELEGIAQSVKNAVRELRDTVNNLRPPSLIRFGLARAMRMHAEDLQERHPEIEIRLDLDENQDHLSEQAHLTLFRIFQEGLNNTIRHSGASQVSVQYRINGVDFLLELHDNGSGFEPRADYASLASTGHYGLLGMQERALIIGAELSILSAPGQGTTVCVRGKTLP